MADRIVILDSGRIAQAGTPEEVYNRPVSSFVAAFMGAENSIGLVGTVAGDRFAITAGPTNEPCAVPLSGRPLADGPVVARFRAEAAKLVPAGDAAHVPEGTLVLPGRVESASYPGGHWRHAVAVGHDTVLADAPQAFAPDAAVKVCVPPEALFLFNPPGAEPAAAEFAGHKTDKASELAGA